MSEVKLTISTRRMRELAALMDRRSRLFVRTRIGSALDAEVATVLRTAADSMDRAAGRLALEKEGGQ